MPVLLLLHGTMEATQHGLLVLDLLVPVLTQKGGIVNIYLTLVHLIFQIYTILNLNYYYQEVVCVRQELLQLVLQIQLLV
jgi:hypothetical protein